MVTSRTTTRKALGQTARSLVLMPATTGKAKEPYSGGNEEGRMKNYESNPKLKTRSRKGDASGFISDFLRISFILISLFLILFRYFHRHLRRWRLLPIKTHPGELLADQFQVPDTYCTHP